MACKTYQIQRCGECKYFDRETYRGVGKTVCYMVLREPGKKIATQVSERQKACGTYRSKNKI